MSKDGGLGSGRLGRGLAKTLRPQRVRYQRMVELGTRIILRTPLAMCLRPRDADIVESDTRLWDLHELNFVRALSVPYNALPSVSEPQLRCRDVDLITGPL